MRFTFLKFFVAAIAGVALQASAQPLPKLDLQDMQGGHHKLEDYKGKVVVLNFWATYCVPCVAELPLLNEMQKRYKDKIIVLAASIDDELDRDKLQPFLHKHHADDLTLLIGASFETLEDFGLGQMLPGTIFIDAEGKIVGKVEGALKRDDLEYRLAQLTGTPEKPKSPSKAHHAAVQPKKKPRAAAGTASTADKTSARP